MDKINNKITVAKLGVMSFYVVTYSSQVTLQYKAAPNSKTLPLAFFLADLHNGGHDVSKRYGNDLISATCFLSTFDTQHIHIHYTYGKN